ncbi:MAG: hypothetical protein AAFV62_09320 [Pseudomonadota bacterium]
MSTSLSALQIDGYSPGALGWVVAEHGRADAALAGLDAYVEATVAEFPGSVTVDARSDLVRDAEDRTSGNRVLEQRFELVFGQDG